METNTTTHLQDPKALQDAIGIQLDAALKSVGSILTSHCQSGLKHFRFKQHNNTRNKLLASI